MSLSVPPTNSDLLAKHALRTRVAMARDRMPALERAEAARRVAALAGAALSSLASGAIVAAYAAKGSELDLTELCRAATAAGCLVAYPRVVPGQRWLDFAIVDAAELIVGGFGLREPAASAPAIALGEISIFFVPGLAFDEQGTRLGWGKGYYDATLLRAPAARRIGVAFEQQVLPRVPRSAHDVSMHELLTEAKRRTFGA